MTALTTPVIPSPLRVGALDAERALLHALVTGRWEV